jgi:hypothetical protein
MAARFIGVVLGMLFDGLQGKRRDKTVAALGDGDDVTLAGLTVTEGFAQCRHVHAQVGVFHYAFGPDPRDQLLLAHHLACVLQQHQQNVHGLPAQAQGLVGLHHQALARVDPVGAEMDGLFGGKGQRVTPACIRLSRGIQAYS